MYLSNFFIIFNQNPLFGSYPILKKTYIKYLKMNVYSLFTNMIRKDGTIKFFTFLKNLLYLDKYIIKTLEQLN